MGPESPYFFQVLNVAKTTGLPCIEQKKSKDELRKGMVGECSGTVNGPETKRVLDLTFPLI